MTERPLELSVCLHTVDSAMVLPQSSHPRQLLAISAATCAESSLVAYGAGHIVAATLLGAGSSAALSWSSASSQFDDPRLARLAAVRTFFVLAVMLMTTPTVISYLREPHLFHGIAGYSRTTSAYVPQHAGRSGPPKSETEGTSPVIRDAYSGIVLWPKKRTHTKLIVPSPATWNQKLASSQLSNPLVIPFDGVYWLFREPDVQPPAKSRQAEGSPEMFDIHSTDWRPLSMEAHQNLGTLIGLDCCARIQVAIRNADEFPTSISIEVVLIDTTASGRPSQSLGRVNIVSNQKWKTDHRLQPTPETLNFLIPTNPAIRRFDEVTISFRLDGFRGRTAAKIGIDHFTLVPRGL
jgi:hypothetical protein